MEKSFHWRATLPGSQINSISPHAHNLIERFGVKYDLKSLRLFIFGVKTNVFEHTVCEKTREENYVVRGLRPT